MRNGWGARRRLRRAATALVALTLLPVAVFVAAGHTGASGTGAMQTRSAVGALDVDAPAVDALQRSEASSLFGLFSWNGRTVSGPFVTFDFNPSTGAVVGLFAVNGSTTELLVNSLRIVGFSPSTVPQVNGSTFTANGVGVTLVAHDEPTGLLEIRSGFMPQTVEIAFPDTTTNLEISQAMVWPRASLSFTIGNTAGRMILGQGTMARNGTTVTAQMAAGDYLALRAVPSFVEHPAERVAVLDAFATGRLAAEVDLVAMTNGGWLENRAQFQPSLSMVGTRTAFGNAELRLSAPETQDGIVLLAFDSQTMPADGAHQLVVTVGGGRVPETPNPLASLYASPGSGGTASYSRLAMNATVLVLYLPSVGGSFVQVESLTLPAPGLDVPTELAMVAAVLVVSVAAAAMFRPREE